MVLGLHPTLTTPNRLNKGKDMIIQDICGSIETIKRHINSTEDKEENNMTYAQEVREKLKQLQEERVQTYKEIMDDIITSQFLDSLGSEVATIKSTQITDYGVSVKDFEYWLECEGFSVSRYDSRNEVVLTISLPPERK